MSAEKDWARSAADDIIRLGWSDGDYPEDEEGADMFAYDYGLADYEDEPEPEYRDPNEPDYRDPLWVIALWKLESDSHELLPLMMCYEPWPIHGGAFDTLAEEWGWELELDKGFAVGGLYFSPYKWNVALVCCSTKVVEESIRSAKGTCFSIIGGHVDWREWGVVQ